MKHPQFEVVAISVNMIARKPLIIRGLFDNEADAHAYATVRIDPAKHSYIVREKLKLTAAFRAKIETLAMPDVYIDAGHYARGPMYYRFRGLGFDAQGKTIQGPVFQKLFNLGFLRRLKMSKLTIGQVDYVLGAGARFNYMESENLS